MFGRTGELLRRAAVFAAISILVLATPGASSTAASAKDAQPAEPPFHIQLWDAQKTDWTDAALAELSRMGFTIVQNGYGGSFFPSAAFLAKITSHGLQYGAYLRTQEYFRYVATPEERAAVERVINYDGTIDDGEITPFDPVYRSVLERATAQALSSITGVPGLYKIMLNSERNAPLSYDQITRDAAVAAGALLVAQSIPVFHRGVWRMREQDPALGYADPYKFLNWWDTYGGDRAINGAVANVAHAVRPGVKMTTDPLADGYCYGQYKDMDIYQDWVRVHKAPRDPLGVAYRTERLKAHVRHFGRGEVWVGPQLGTANGEDKYAAPADQLEEALWLAAAFGARGVTMWGYNAIRRDNRVDVAAWKRVQKFHDLLYKTRPQLLGATDVPRICAVLMSKANVVYSDRPYYECDDNYEFFYRCLLTAHVQADVLYDEDVLDGELANYRVLFLAGIEATTDELDAKIAEFEASGGRVVRLPYHGIFYRDYDIVAGRCSDTYDFYAAHPEPISLYPHQYRQWRRIKAAAIWDSVADLMTVACDNPDVIMNLIQSGGKRYIVLVNDKRTYGPWTKAIGYKIAEDKGLGARANLTIKQDDGTIRKMTVSLPKAGTRIIEY